MFSNKLAKISHWNRNPIRPMFSALRVEANRKDIKQIVYGSSCYCLFLGLILAP